MFAFLICILTLHHVHSACVAQVADVCTENAAVQTEIVDLHNAFRRAVQPAASNMLKMWYDGDLADSAQAWVDKCILAHGPPSTHMLNGYVLGENLFYSSSPYSWTDVINAWHSEVSNYNYPNISTNGKAIGHYTQVVWNTSYKVGCGVAFCHDTNIYLYGCHYYRAGNFRGWPPYALGEPCALCPGACEDKLCTNPCPYIDKYLNCPALKNSFGCGNDDVYASCPASCKCTDEIIPVGRR